MNTLLITVLSLSLSGAILIAILFLCKPLYKERLSKRWQYYIWLIVIVRLMLPLSFEVNLVGSLFDTISQPSTTITAETTEAAPSNSGELTVSNPIYPGVGLNTSEIHGNAPYSQATIPETHTYVYEVRVIETASRVNIWGLILPNLWLIWLTIALVLFARKVAIYQGFARYIKAGRVEVTDIEVLERFGKILEQENIKKTIAIYTHSHVSSPLLIGFFRPYIVLPTLDISETDFRYTILHELTHYKRKDMFYKWLVQFVICLHWFNPLVHLMGREINNLGELSCDEAVIKNLDNDGMRAYGDSLLNASKMSGGYSNALASVTLNSNKKILKERLDLIMKFKKKSKLIAVVAICATMLLSIGAVITGAYATGNASPVVNEPNIERDYPANLQVARETEPLLSSQGIGILMHPLPESSYRLSTPFGARFGRMHNGVDWAAPRGTHVIAADGGIVTFSDYSGAMGNHIIIYHGEGVETIYAHLNERHVSEGDQVFQGQHIGDVGSTGRSTGPHLHFEVRINGIPRNPLHFFDCF